MNNELRIPVRLFSLIVRDERTGTLEMDHLTLTKQQLQAAQIVGQSATELIHRIYNRQGYRVIEIGKPARTSVEVDIYFHQDAGTVVLEGETLVVPVDGVPPFGGDTLD